MPQSFSIKNITLKETAKKILNRLKKTINKIHQRSMTSMIDQVPSNQFNYLHKSVEFHSKNSKITRQKKSLDPKISLLLKLSARNSFLCQNFSICKSVNVHSSSTRSSQKLLTIIWNGLAVSSRIRFMIFLQFF